MEEKQCGNWYKAIVPCIEKINKALGEKVLISDKEKVVFETDSSEFKGKPIGREVKEVFGYTKFNSSNSTLPTITFRKSTEVVENKVYENAIIATLLNNGCYLGSIIVLPKSKIEFRDSRTNIIQQAVNLANEILNHI